MFHATERLPHLLSPSAYCSDTYFSGEMTTVFKKSWHFVALKSELSRFGDFVTLEICGQPIQVRNIAGAMHAVSNICAHRHCLLTSRPKGSTPTLRCQYHGWEYHASGATARIPMAQHFAPLDRASAKISAYRVETLGDLVFVNLDAATPDLKTCLGDSFESIQQGFGTGWEKMLFREVPHPVNWKIPIENSLESYHVPAIHAETFRDDPGEERSEHNLGVQGTSLKTTLPFGANSKADRWFQQAEGRVLRTFTRCRPTATYQQHHVFPNMLFSFTDMVSLLHVVRPTGPQSCSSIIYQFGRVGTSSVSRRICRFWGYLAASLTLKILREDFRLYPDIQRGLNFSTSPGMLGRCEERIYQFQRWIQNHTTSENSSASSLMEVDPAEHLSCDCHPNRISDSFARRVTER